MDFSKIKLFVDLDGTAAVWNAAGEYEDLFKEGYFLNLRPHENVVKGVKKLYECGLDVYVLSAYLTESRFALREKMHGLKHTFPLWIEETGSLFPRTCPSQTMYLLSLENWTISTSCWMTIRKTFMNGRQQTALALS